jgi:hypothetical protein
VSFTFRALGLAHRDVQSELNIGMFEEEGEAGERMRAE